jgi:hypothetical protein
MEDPYEPNLEHALLQTWSVIHIYRQIPTSSTRFLCLMDGMHTVSVDEALVDVPSIVKNARRHTAAFPREATRPDFAKELAETVRGKSRNATGREGARVSTLSEKKIRCDVQK